jgi:hypothetical protein
MLKLRSRKKRWAQNTRNVAQRTQEQSYTKHKKRRKKNTGNAAHRTQETMDTEQRKRRHITQETRTWDGNIKKDHQ